MPPALVPIRSRHTTGSKSLGSSPATRATHQFPSPHPLIFPAPAGCLRAERRQRSRRPCCRPCGILRELFVPFLQLPARVRPRTTAEPTPVEFRLPCPSLQSGFAGSELRCISVSPHQD